MINFQRPTLLACIAIGFAAFAPISYAQAPAAPTDTSMVDATSRAQIVDVLADDVRDMYVFPDVAAKIEAALRKKLKDGGYDHLKYSVGFAAELTSDMRRISHDLHLDVRYSDEPLPIHGTDIALNAEDEAVTFKLLQASNFGVGTVEKLPANIGYLELQSFEPLKYSRQTIAATMAQLADSDALIIDLRGNGGGEPETVALLASYFFDQRTQLSALHFREGDRTVQYWTDENVAGPRFGPTKPVYIVMGGRTFSAAEELSYDLKSLKRATLVGQPTGGGAHENAFKSLNANFIASISIGEAVNPVTHSNWEGTGVEPDVHAPVENALLVAQKLSVQAVTAAEKDPQKLLVLRARLSELDAQLAQAAGPNVK